MRRLFWGSPSPQKQQGFSISKVFVELSSHSFVELTYINGTGQKCVCAAFCPFVLIVVHLVSSSRISWSLCSSVKSLPGSWAWGLHWLSQVTQKPCIQTLAVPLYNFSEHNGSLSCNDLLLFNSKFPLTFHDSSNVSLFFFQELPVQKQSDYVQDFYQSLAKYFKGEFISLQVIMYCLSPRCLDCAPVFRFYWHSGHTNNGAFGEADHDPLVQVGFLSRQLWWRAQRSDSAETNTVNNFIYNTTDVLLSCFTTWATVTQMVERVVQ